MLLASYSKLILHLLFCSGNIQNLSNPAFHPDTIFEEKNRPVKNDDDETTTDGGKDENEFLKQEFSTWV